MIFKTTSKKWWNYKNILNQMIKAVAFEKIIKLLL